MTTNEMPLAAETRAAADSHGGIVDEVTITQSAGIVKSAHTTGCVGAGILHPDADKLSPTEARIAREDARWRRIQREYRALLARAGMLPDDDDGGDIPLSAFAMEAARERIREREGAR